MATPLGSTPGIIVGVGVGTAAAAAIEPLVVTAAQQAWSKNAFKVFPPGALAELVAQGYITTPQAEAESVFSGWNPARMDAMVQLALRAPGVAEALTLLRRSGGPDLTPLGGPDALFTHALRKAAIEPQWDAGLAALRWHLLDFAAIANAVQQGHLPNPGILPDLATNVPLAPGATTPASPDGQPPTSVPLTQIPLDPIAEAEGLGWSLERLQVQANLSGLPPGQHELLEMWNRGLIDEASVDAGIREGHTKTKWIGPFKRLRWAVLSELQYVEARVRGWITNEQMYEGGALRGYTKAQLDLLHSTHGRPLSFRDVARALRRGAVRLNPTADFTGANPVGANGEQVAPIPDALFRSLQQSNIQQQWYDMARVMAVNYPSLFMLNHLAQADPTYIDRAVQILNFGAYDPTDIAAIEAFWRGGTTAKQKGETASQLAAEYEEGIIDESTFVAALEALGHTAAQAAREVVLADDRATKAARARALRSVEKQYIGSRITDATATSDLQAIGVPATAIARHLAAWRLERADAATTLTEAQVKKAVVAGVYTAAQGVDLLQGLGMTAADANTFLAS